MLRKAVFTIFCILLLAPAWSVSAGPDPTLIGWWWFDEGAGTAASDSSNFGNHGTLTGGPTWTTGVFGSALKFDGVDDYVLVPHNESLCVSSEVAVAVWINPGRYNGPTGDPWQGIIGKQEGQRSYNLYTYTGGVFHFSTAGVGTTSTGTVPLNEWSHVCAMVKGGTHVYIVNGADGGTSGSGVALPGTADTANVVIGRTNEGTARSWLGMLDDVRVYNRSLTQAEVQEIMTGKDMITGLATSPSPGSGATDVRRDAVLAWNVGQSAVTHNVYFGPTFEDANSAGDPTDTVAVAEYDPEGLLEYGQTYYWRVDEVNGAPDYTTFKGEVWSFTAEPYGYPIANVTVQASGAQPGSPAINTVNGSGLNSDDQHGVDLKTMWVAPAGLPAWIQYTFEKEYKLHELWVWNANSELEMFMGFGAKDVVIEYSTDGETWTALENVPQFAQGTGQATYTANTIVDLGEVLAKHVKLTINTLWGGTGIPSLSEVRFFYSPAQAFEPTPANDATEVAVSATLDWRPGREATSHEVYFGTDANAVAEGAVAPETVTEHRYTPDSMDFGTTYYWRVDEVGDSGTFAGDVWSFTSKEFEVVEDFESYNDDIDGGTTIWQAWIDGLTTEASGSTIGYENSPFAERTIVHNGAQSMPFAYDNATKFYFSEAERTFDPVQKWTGNGADAVGLWVRGNPAKFVETAPGQYTVSSKSADIWGTSDNFRFVYKRLSGNGSISAKVLSITGGSTTWAKAGVMIRGSLDPASTYALMHPTPDGRRSFQNRPTDGASAVSAHSATGAITFPLWVKVERQGNQITAYYSLNGTTWTKQPDTENTGTDKSPNPQTISMTDPVYIGLAVAGNDTASSYCFGEFSDVVATGSVTGDWTVASIGANPGNDVATMYVTVEDSAGKKATATNADIVTAADWTRWAIPMSDFTGVNFGKVKKMTITIGDKNATKAGGVGMVFIDDIGYGHSAQ